MKKTTPWVLLTDDSPTVCQMLSGLLKRDGHEAQALDNYLELPRLLRETPPSLIVLDLERPGGLSGAALGRFVRSYEVKKTPILVFSSLPKEERLRILRLVGADATVGKDESLEVLRMAMLQLLSAPVQPGRS